MKKFYKYGLPKFCLLYRKRRIGYDCQCTNTLKSKLEHNIDKINSKLWATKDSLLKNLRISQI